MKYLVVGMMIIALALGTSAFAADQDGNLLPVVKHGKEVHKMDMPKSGARGVPPALSDPMMQKHQMMVRMRVEPLDPEALMAMRAELGLTPDQVAKLKDIADRARTESQAVLTPTQIAQAEKLKPGPDSMLAMQRQMGRMRANRMSEMPMHHMEANEPNAMPAKSMSMEQTTCPLTGQPIDKKVSIQYKGKTVYFCCAACIAPFKKNPEKYLSKLPQFMQ
jgi:YHS domain-containing protein